MCQQLNFLQRNQRRRASAHVHRASPPCHPYGEELKTTGCCCGAVNKPKEQKKKKGQEKHFVRQTGHSGDLSPFQNLLNLAHTQHHSERAGRPGDEKTQACRAESCYGLSERCVSHVRCRLSQCVKVD